jgi:TIR domain
VNTGFTRHAILALSQRNDFATGPPMSKIIVSYRRSDSQAVAGRIVDHLISHFGADAVFMDVDNIPFGIDFRDHIHSVLSKAAVLIAIVGPDWLGVDDEKHRRIDDEDDPVRVELETALKQKLLVIPVLVNDATMPKAGTLPDTLRGFSFLNAAPVDVGRDFRPHVDRLVRSIESVLAARSDATALTAADAAAAAPGGPAPAPSRPGNSSAMLIAAAIALLVVAGGGAWWFGAPSSHGSGTAALPTATTPAPSLPTVIAQAAPAASPPAGPPTDDIRWDVLKDTTDVGLLIRFIEQYPDSKHRAEAEHRIGLLTQQTQPQPQPGTMAVPSSAPAAAPAAAAPDPTDEKDWAVIQKTNSYESYQAYVRRHPQGAHVAEAIKAAVDNALIAEPAVGRLPTGETVLVDDRVCDADHIKAITGGDVNKGVSRTKKCVPRSMPF